MAELRRLNKRAKQGGAGGNAQTTTAQKPAPAVLPALIYDDDASSVETCSVPLREEHATRLVEPSDARELLTLSKIPREARAQLTTCADGGECTALSASTSYAWLHQVASASAEAAGGGRSQTTYTPEQQLADVQLLTTRLPMLNLPGDAASLLPFAAHAHVRSGIASALQAGGAVHIDRALQPAVAASLLKESHAFVRRSGAVNYKTKGERHEGIETVFPMNGGGPSDGEAANDSVCDMSSGWSFADHPAGLPAGLQFSYGEATWDESSAHQQWRPAARLAAWFNNAAVVRRRLEGTTVTTLPTVTVVTTVQADATVTAVTAVTIFTPVPTVPPGAAV